MLDRLFLQNEIVGTAMQAAVVRNDVISNNIANADTPGYKAKSVSFEESLIGVLAEWKRSGVPDLTKAVPSVNYVNRDFHYRLDQNNVDIESEMAALYKNSVKYDALTSAILNNSKRLNLVITGR